MGAFECDFDALAEEIRKELEIKEAASASVSGKAKYIMTQVQAEVRQCFMTIVGSRSVRLGMLKNGVIAEYNETNEAITIDVNNKALFRPSMKASNKGIYNIINLIATGYPTDGRDHIGAVRGYWRGSSHKIVSRTQRKPYTRYNMVKKNNTEGSSSTSKIIVGVSKEVPITHTLDVMLDNIANIISKYKLSADITIGPAFISAVSRPQRTTLYGESDQI